MRFGQLGEPAGKTSRPPPGHESRDELRDARRQPCPLSRTEAWSAGNGVGVALPEGAMKRSFLSDPGLSKAPAHCPDAVGKALDGSVIEVDIGKGGKKTIGQRAVQESLSAPLPPWRHAKRRISSSTSRSCKARCGRLLAADARFDAAGISGSLLTLKTEHI